MQLVKLLGTQMDSTDVHCDDIEPRAIWAGNPAIERWGLCWREDPQKRVEIACSIVLKGNLMPGSGLVLAIEEREDNPENVDILICLMPIRDPDGEPDCVAVSLPWRKCNEEVCGKAANQQGMTFDGPFPKDLEEFMTSWTLLNIARVTHNDNVEAAIESEKEKGKKKASAPRRKSTGDQAIVEAHDAGEGSKPKRKAKVSKDKPLILSLDEALIRGNRMSSKTKEEELDAIYKALESGLSSAFPYKKKRLPGVIPSDKLHIAPDTLKYRKIAKERLGQVSAR